MPTAATLQQPQGVRLDDYASYLGVPAEFLRGVGLSQIHYADAPAVRIPYEQPNGSSPSAVRFRVSLHKSGTGDGRFRWGKGHRPCLYGLDRLEDARGKGYVVLVEGESDCHVLWYRGEPAVGIPGATNWKEEWAAHLDGIGVIYVVCEPDRGGEAVLRWLKTSRLRHVARIVSLGEYKDPRNLYLDAPESFTERWHTALAEAVPWPAVERERTSREAAELWGECEHIATQPDILDSFASALRRDGVVGETRSVRLLYLALTSRLLDKPVSVAVKGVSSSGKSYQVEGVLRFFPGSAYHVMTAASERALAYDDEPLAHRFLVVLEAPGVQGETATYLLRSLLSEGRLVYITVEKTPDGLRSRRIEREGPTGLLTTTTAQNLHSENETRFISLTSDDSHEQTAAILMELAREDREEVDHGPWQAMQRWLELQNNRVSIPFSTRLVESIPPVSVRLRRDGGSLLQLIRTHAVLHQASRGRDSKGRIVATLDDYAAVRELVADVVAHGTDVSVPSRVRETVQTVASLLEGAGQAHVNKADVARAMGVDRSTAMRRVNAAIAGGYLRDTRPPGSREYQIVLGDPMPDDQEVLPSVEALQCCLVAAESACAPPPPPVAIGLTQQSVPPAAAADYSEGVGHSARPATGVIDSGAGEEGEDKDAELRASLLSVGRRAGYPKLADAPDCFPSIGAGEQAWRSACRHWSVGEVQALLTVASAKLYGHSPGTA